MILVLKLSTCFQLHHWFLQLSQPCTWLDIDFAFDFSRCDPEHLGILQLKPTDYTRSSAAKQPWLLPRNAFYDYESEITSWRHRKKLKIKTSITFKHTILKLTKINLHQKTLNGKLGSWQINTHTLPTHFSPPSQHRVFHPFFQFFSCPKCYTGHRRPTGVCCISSTQACSLGGKAHQEEKSQLTSAPDVRSAEPKSAQESRP